MSDYQDVDQMWEASYPVPNLQRPDDWSPIYLDLGLLKLVSELGPNLSKGNTDIIKAMVEDGANLEGIDNTDTSFPVDGELDEMYDGVENLTAHTPLIWAILANNKRATDLLLELGADANSPNSSGEVPLEVAIKMENPAIVEALIDGNAILDEPMSEVRKLEERINRGDRSRHLKEIVNLLYEMIFTRVEQRGGYYLS